MADRTYKLVVPVTVAITVTDEPVGEVPQLHPLDPRRMEGIYPCNNPGEMLAHLAYNAVMNHKECASGLDGWGDIRVLPDDADNWAEWRRIYHVRKNHPVRMEVVDVDIYDVDFLDTPPTTDDVQGPA